MLAAPEDIVLHKRPWYMISPTDRQLTDSAGILSVSGDVIDNAYLDQWARRIGVEDLQNRIREGKVPPKSTETHVKQYPGRRALDCGSLLPPSHHSLLWP